jgi:myo-inositol-1(or 4)-monophosphatase
MTQDLRAQDVLAFLDQVTSWAGKVLATYFHGEFRIDRKGPTDDGIDIVTDADRASEEIILEAIRREYPDHDILTEETDIESTGARWLWIVDPLDGTVNFAHGFPHFCISIALMDRGELVAGMIHDPLRKENFWAAQGKGAFLNGARIRVSTADRLSRSIVATGFPYDRATSPINNVAEFTRVVTRVQGIRRAGSAALDLAYVASGRFDGFWELKLKAWDQAAGMLIVQEAGGRVTDRFGKPTTCYTDAIVATNGLIHDELVSRLGES